MENLFFDTYLEMVAGREGKIPALFPQVWLYYDPKLQKDRIKKIFEHQRMDFLMLFSESQRVVIEIDECNIMQNMLKVIKNIMHQLINMLI